MEWLDTSTANCSIQATLDVIGEKWTVQVLREVFNGVRRFDDMHRHIGVSEPILADRLRKLVEADVLRTEPYREPGKRSRNQYRLTPKGRDLLPVLLSLLQWGDEYYAGPAGPPLVVRERASGKPVEVVVRVAGGDRGLTARETVGVVGPGARPRQALRESVPGAS